YYTVQAGQSVSSRELEAWLRGSLPDFMVPSHFVELVKFPLTPNGKIDRKALPPPDPKSHKEGFGTEQPSSELERAIAEVWKRLLGLSRVGIHDNFFELGGHSLLAVQAHREIKAIAQKPFSVTDVFRFPTIASLARYLGDSNGSSESSRNLQASAERAQARRQAIEQRAQLRRR
ncbi:MAG: phosphopantetheine-binding protein, partial [Deltaproteobacteria bacterium]|nr:phosphopantetheine-binding protein [Deltaproteobacteria bacterium]